MAVAACTGGAVSDGEPPAKKKSGRGNAVVTEDDNYMEGIKLYGIGIKDDPVPGEKRGKGMQRMNSS